jgi:uncharacterized DUF497 family protein
LAIKRIILRELSREARAGQTNSSSDAAFVAARQGHRHSRRGTLCPPDLLPSSYMMVIYNMLNLSQIEGFEWDEGNSRKSAEKHDVSQAEAEQVFFNEPLLIVEDVSHSSYEIRLHALGHTDAGRLLHISFTLRGNGKLIRVISARTMHRKEQLRYEQEA